MHNLIPDRATGTPPCRRRWTAIVASATVLAVTGAAALITDTGPSDTGQQHMAASVGPARLRAAPEPTLVDAAARILAASEAQGRFEHRSVETWASGGEGITPMREQRWFDPASRRTWTFTWKLPSINRADFSVRLVGHTDFRSAQPDTAEYTTPADTLRPPPSGDPAALLRQLSVDSDDSYSAVAAVESIPDIHAFAHLYQIGDPNRSTPTPARPCCSQAPTCGSAARWLSSSKTAGSSGSRAHTDTANADGR